jgi:MoaA/NifB/PqqE/SkfB family radical SAM enzyme
MAIWSADAVLRVKKLRERMGCLAGLNFLWLEITRRCNLTCEHCYVSSGPGLPLTEGMRHDDWCRVLDDARAAGCRRVQFIGGEPTIHPDLPRLLEHARHAGFSQCEVFTNATLLREDLVQTFKRLGVLVHFSFYSYDPAVHDRLTGQAGSFERTVAGTTRLLAHRVRVSAGLIRATDDAEHLKKTRRFLKALGVRSIAEDRVRGVGRGQALVPGVQPRKELCGACWRGKLCVDAAGNARPCVFTRDVSVGNVLESGLSAVVNGTPLRAFRRAMFMGDEGGLEWPRPSADR